MFPSKSLLLRTKARNEFYLESQYVVSLRCFTGRYQDENTQAFFLVVSCNRWLAVRLDLLSSVFVTVVAVGAILVTENPGELVKALSLSNASLP